MANDVTKLPKWAQDLIADKDRKIGDLESEIVILKKGYPPSRVIVEPYYDRQLGMTNGMFLPERTTIRFILGNGKNLVDAYLHSNGCLYLNSHGTMLVKPQASNCVFIDAINE